MFEAIGDFFKQIGRWISGLFGGEDVAPAPPEPNPTIEVGPLEQIGIEPEEPVENGTEPDSEPEETPAEKETQEAESEGPPMNSTPAVDETEDGIIDAYFAKRILKKIGDEISQETTYNFGNPHDTATEQQKRQIAGDIIAIKETGWSDNDEFAYEAVIASKLVKTRYEAGDPVKFNLYKMQPGFERIDSSPLESDVYIFAKTANLDEKEITITIHEKDELLVGVDEPLPVLKRDDTKEDQKSKDLEEIIELKGTIDEGSFYIPIRLRPKDDEDLQKWKDKLAGKKDKNGTEITPPQNSVKELLWLKTTCQGNEKKHDKEFLNEKEETYFKLVNCCSAAISTEQLQEIFTSASDNNIESLKNSFNNAFEKFSINTCLRRAHFFAQIREEVGPSITTFAESLNYPVDRLKTTFSYFRNNPTEAALYGRSEEHPANQQAIANRAYANRLGNGNIASGDGWNYRGKGYIQLTGKENYENVNDEIQRLYSESGIDIIATPDDILTTDGALISAMAYWTLNGLNELADNGSTDANVNAITAVINFHTESYPQRRTHFNTTKETFHVDECPNK